MSPCVSPPPSCTDRPRCYALMREDYLWSPLQSACSMQHLRSVPSLGRQVLALRPHSHTPVPAQPNTRFLNNTVLLLTPTALHAIPSRAGNLSTVSVLYCHPVPQVLTHIMQISHEPQPHPAARRARNVHERRLTTVMSALKDFFSFFKKKKTTTCGYLITIFLTVVETIFGRNRCISNHFIGSKDNFL